MATHDYVIDNSTGANVRSDLNNVLQAILTNNSSSSAPSTTAAYMWWADTTNGVLKIRNSANDGWVELLQLDGTLTLEDGTVSAPGLAFRDDLNTGIFSSAADTLNVTTGGVERLELGTTTIFNDDGADVDFIIESDDNANMFYVDAGNDRIGIGTNSPSSALEISVGNSGTTSSAGFNEFSIEGANEDIGMCFLSPAANNVKQRISFGDSNNNNSGEIKYDHNTDDLTLKAADDIILSGDSVGIGTTSPTKTLHVSGASSPEILLSSTNASPAIFAGDSNRDTDGQHITEFRGRWNGTRVARIVIQAGNDTTNKDNGQLVFETASAGTTTEALRIDESGNILCTRQGIPSVVTPFYLGVVGQSSIVYGGGANDTASLRIEDKGSSNSFYHGIEFRSKQGGDARIYAHDKGSDKVDLVFATDNNGMSERMRLDSSGNLCLGEVGEPAAGTDGIRFEANGTTKQSCTGTGERNVFEFKNANGNVGKIVTQNSNTTYGTSSDYRLKENVVAISDGITRLKQLKPSRFNFIVKKDLTQDGFLAHEVQSVVPEAISGEKDAVKEDGSIDPQAIDLGRLVPLLVAAVQELITKVETLEAA